MTYDKDNDPAMRRTEAAHRILWVHNYQGRQQGMFMWDIYDVLSQRLDIDFYAVPLKPSIAQVIVTCLDLRRLSRNYAIVHAQFGSLVGFVAAFSAKAPMLVLRGTDLYPMPASPLARWTETPVRQLLTYIACLRARAIVVMSDRMAKDLRQWPFMERKRIVVITDPVGKEFVSTEESLSVSTASGQQPLKVFVGVFLKDNPIKRTWIIREASKLCCNSDIHVELCLVSGRPRHEVRAIMKECDVVALASIHEGWPNIVKEGLLMGLPFVATNVSDLPILASPLSGNYIVPPEPIEFANALVETYYAKRVGTLRARFLPECVASKYNVLYNSILYGARSI